jgi:hypothetical protein
VTATEWLQKNSGWLALAGLGLSAAGFVLLPWYLHQDLAPAVRGDVDRDLDAPAGYAITLRRV